MKGEEHDEKSDSDVDGLVMMFSMTACGGSKPADGGNDSGSAKPAAASSTTDSGAADTAAVAQSGQSEQQAEMR